MANMRTIQGKKIGKEGMFPDAVDRKGDVVYPSFYIDVKHLPEAKEWEIGKTYDVTLRIKQTGLNLHRHEGRKEDYGNADFEILGIEPHGEVKKDPKTHSRIKPSKAKAPVVKEKIYSRIKSKD